MTLSLVITFGVLLGGWSFLRVLGNERQRQVQQRAQAIPPPAPAPTPEDPVGDRVAR